MQPASGEPVRDWADLFGPFGASWHEVGREDGHVYIVSDCVEGVNLAEWLSPDYS